MPTTGDRLQALRKARGWSLRKVAMKTGMSSSNVSMYEHDHINLSLERAAQFARLYNVSLDALVGITGGESDECRQLRRENARMKKELLRLREMNLNICEEIRGILFPDPLMEDEK